jgi:hypothetical protein
VKRLTFALLVLVTAVTAAQPPITSGVPPYPGRAPVFSPPNIQVGIVMVTNDRPIVVERTVSSNVVQTTIWYHNGNQNTNETVLSSSVISRTTNTIEIHGQ